MIAKFTNENEFIEELKLDWAHLPETGAKPILRVCVRHRYNPPFTEIDVIASYVREDGGLTRLIHHVGTHVEDGVRQKANEIADKIRAAGRSFRMDVRAGVFEEGQS